MSVRLRAALGAAAVFGLVFAVAAVLGIALLRSSLVSEVDRSIETRALDIEIQTADEELVPFVGAGLDPSTVAAIVDVEGNVLSSTDVLDGDLLVELYRAHDGPFDMSLPDLDSVQGSENMRGITLEVVESDEFVETFVFAAASIDGVERTVRGARNLALLAGPLLVVLVGVLVYVMAGRALRPVERIRSEVEEITGSDLHRRVPQPATGDEIAALASTMNSMLARIETDAERQRRFVADASHELRSPLASMAARLDVDRAHPETADPATTAAGLRAETERMQRLVDDLLLLARSDEAELGPELTAVVALDDVVLDAVAHLAPDDRVEVRTRATARVDVAGDPGLLGRLVTNLLTNARRHAASVVEVEVAVGTAGAVDAAVGGAGAVDAAMGGVDAGPGAVDLRGEVSSRIAWVIVDDDGPGIPVADRTRVFERFVRLDDARSRDAGGSGLGLALCERICRLHGGAIEVADSPLGGARLSVRLPLTGPVS